MIINVRSRDGIYLGKTGEQLAIKVVFDAAQTYEEYGKAGTFKLLNMRPDDTAPYPVPVTVADGRVYWDVRSMDNSTPGRGTCELQYYIGERIVKSETWDTRVDDGIGDNPDAPEYWQGWQEMILQATVKAEKVNETVKERAENARASAAESKTAAERARQIAGAANASAYEALGNSEQALTKAATAESNSTAARNDASEAVRVATQVRRFYDEFAEPNINRAVNDASEAKGRIAFAEALVVQAEGFAERANEVYGAWQRGELDGRDGDTPVKGIDYFDGEPGYTPVKGQDYFDGYTPVKGLDYFTPLDKSEWQADLSDDVAAAKAEIVQQGQDTLASIPADYSTLANDVSQLNAELEISGLDVAETHELVSTNIEQVISPLNLKAGIEYILTFNIDAAVANILYNYLMDSNGTQLVSASIAAGNTSSTGRYTPATDMTVYTASRTTKTALVGTVVHHRLVQGKTDTRLDRIELSIDSVNSDIANIGIPKFIKDFDFTPETGSFTSIVGSSIEVSTSTAWNRAIVDVTGYRGKRVKVSFTKRNSNETASVAFTDAAGVVIAERCKYGTTAATELKTEILLVPNDAAQMYVKSYEGYGVSKIQITAQDTESLYEKAYLTPPAVVPHMKYVCHQGVVTKAPLNTKRAYEEAGRQGVYALNMARGRISLDGTIWIHHDADISSDTDGTGIVEELRDSYLSTIRVTDKQSYSEYDISDFTFDDIHLLTLEEGIQICLKYGMIPMIRMDSHGQEITAAVRELVDAYNLADKVIFSGNANFILAMHNLYPNAPCNYYNALYNADEFLQKFTEWGIPANSVFSAMIISPTLADVKKLHKAGYGVFSAFAYDKNTYRRAQSIALARLYAEMGCDYANVNDVIGTNEF